MTHDHEPNPFDRDYWEDRYGAPGYTWSGNPNPVLVTEAAPLPPGRALDIGSGEGGDAIWLATQGWRVTGVDIAVAALEKARALAETRDSDAARRIDWQQHDLSTWAPEPGAFDLVSAQFMHLPDPTRTIMFHSLAAAVAPGGTLLIVGHDVSTLPGDQSHEHHLSLMFGVDDVVAAIDGEGLRIDVAELRMRLPAATDGPTSAVRDVVVRATRAPERR
jgi:SAM-dependent methyltransferase